ncbi:MAG TPA: thiamine diphosphokinase [Dehalococcoidia bacterium]
MNAVVVAGGELELSERVRNAVQTAELLIAADSGAKHLRELRRNADLLIGDFDSFDPALAGAAEVAPFPRAKDQTDTHLAVREAVRRGATRITLIASLRGPRLDHGAANLLLLSADEFAGIDLRAIDGPDELRAVRHEASIAGQGGDLVTLLAVTRRAAGVSTDGLAYQLHEATLRRGDSRGVSNVLEREHGAVRLRHGVLLVIHRAGGDPNAIR